MATWNGDSMLVQHRCGAQMWCESQRVGDEYYYEFRAFAIIGSVWWKGEVITTCPRCATELHPFMSKQWMEA